MTAPEGVTLLHGGPAEPETATAVLDRLLQSGAPASALMGSPLRTGFPLLDRLLDGGLRMTDLMLIGGNPGVGKTVAALQMARQVARDGRDALYVCYEHDAATLLGRLLAMELGELSTPDLAPELDRLRKVVTDATSGYRDLAQVLADEPLVHRAHDVLVGYSDHLRLVRASGAHTDLKTLDALVKEVATGGALFVDYLQKVAVNPAPTTESEKVTLIAEGLKDMAMRHNVVVIALVAADREALDAGRLRLHHLRGSSALAYECDVAILLNDKHRAVARTHLSFDPVRAESFKQQVVFSIEKNRGGPAMVDIEHRKDFLHYRFDPHGGYLAERLLDDRLEPS